MILHILTYFPCRPKHHRADGRTRADRTEKLHQTFAVQLAEMTDAYSGWAYDLANGVDHAATRGNKGYSMRVYDTFGTFTSYLSSSI